MPIRIVCRRHPAGESKTAVRDVKLPFTLPPAPPGIEQLPAGISLCMIVKNEEKFLRQCLASVAGVVDEMVVVDTGSTDSTVSIAESFGATVIHREWRNDFSWARNEALKLAKYRWIFVLDADEELDPGSGEIVRALSLQPANMTGVWLRCINRSDDYKGTGAMSNALVRIFPNSPRLRYRNPIHEFVAIDESALGADAVMSPITITHHGYLSEIVHSRGKAKRNLEIAKASAEQNPDEPFNWSNLGLTAAINDDFELAIEALERMRAMVGDQLRGFVPNSLAMLADIYVEQRQDYEKAIVISKESLKKAPRFANAHFVLGRALNKLGRLDEAIEAFKAAIDDGKYTKMQFVVDEQVSIWKAHSEIGRIYIAQGRHEDALRYFDGGLANQPDVQPLLNNRAKALEGLQRLDEALETYRRLFDTYHDEYSAIQLGSFLLRQKRYADALSFLNQAVPHMSAQRSYELFADAASVSEQAGDDAASEAFALRARSFCPDSDIIRAALERIYARRGDDAAIARLRAADLERPCVAPVDFLRRSWTLFNAGDFQLARTAAVEGLALVPEDIPLALAAARAELKLGRLVEGLERLNAVPADSPYLAEAAFTRGSAFVERGEPEQALPALRIAVKASPAHVDAACMLARLLRDRGELEAAESVLKGAGAGKNGRIAVELAALYFSAGRYDDAREVAEFALATQER